MHNPRFPISHGWRKVNILLYTAAPDSEGTLGGLVELGEPQTLGRHLQQALESMRLCASDPLCSEHRRYWNPRRYGMEMHDGLPRLTY